MPDTMVLRFRDLVEDTISEHRRLVAEFDDVWWGWWNKPNENIPRHTFSSFQETIESEGSLSIFLLDSGHLRLYRAELLEIRTSPTKKAIECPEPKKTPGYYSTAKYKAWWRLRKIEDVQTNEIRNWAYARVDEYIDDSGIAWISDKRIFDIDEMLNISHRTIYFIRQYIPSKDKDYQLYLVPAYGSVSFITTKVEQRIQLVPHVEFSNFMTDPICRESTYIAHLSDIHFSAEHHGFDLEKGRVRKPLWAILSEDLIDACGGMTPSAVIISGDFTWRGIPEEFDLAYEFLSNLESAIGLRREHFIIVPGNHDIQWGKQGEEYLRDKPVDALPEQAERNYRDFYLKYFKLEPNEYLSMGRRYVLGNYASLDIVGLNSCRLEQKHFAGYGFIGLEQLNHAANKMRWLTNQYRTKFRLIIPHHHLIPVNPLEEINGYDKIYSLSLDSGQCTFKFLELGVDLVAHGHMHQPFVGCVSRASKGASFPHARSLTIHGAGSAGARRKHLGSIGKNSFSIYKFDEDRVEVSVRSTSEDQRSFTEDWRCCLHRNRDGGLLIE